MKVFRLPKRGPHPKDRKVEPDAMGFSPDGRLLAVTDFGRVFVIDTTARVVWPICSNGDPVRFGVPGVGFTSDGRGVVAFHEGWQGNSAVCVARVYDVVKGTVQREFVGERSQAAEPGPGGQLVYLGVETDPRHIEIIRWNPLTGKKKRPFARHVGWLRQLAISADEKWVAGSDHQRIRVWNLGGSKLPTRATRTFRLKGRFGIPSLSLSSDGAYLAGNDHGVSVWEVQTGKKWTVVGSPASRGREVAFHPTRPVLAFSGLSSEVRFWDAAARSERKRYAWGIGQITAVAFDPGGLRCAAGAAGKVVVWDVDL